MKKPVILFPLLAIFFFAAMWLAFPFLYENLLNGLRTAAKTIVFTSASMGIELTVAFRTALSFGILPLLAWGIFALVRKLRNPEYPDRKRFPILLLMVGAYVIGFIVKYLLLRMQLNSIASHLIAPESIMHTIPLNRIYFYDYALIFSAGAGLMVLAFAKKKVASGSAER